MSEKLFSQEDVDRMLEKERRGPVARQIESLQAVVNRQEQLRAVIAEHGIEPAEGESVADAAGRLLNQWTETAARREADHLASVNAMKAESDSSIAEVKAEIGRINAQRHSHEIDFAIGEAARKHGAFDAEQLRAFVRPHVQTMGDEHVVRTPGMLQSIDEFVDAMRVDPASANLFREGLGLK
ncbi:hypothetical protein Pan44_35360 [Caulifigura coniformis]|uniref:Uncharacterized protein n=1 Tax=Caulifigura coniformis TaxID=2527983 RepID=A0A517SHA6_9PLAN|nr:hypothetical protein [Caulifigura coniformis]QDT55492.1 hypothetical protein Pan44_35360 [Caulifigura coniformis]